MFERLWSTLDQTFVTRKRVRVKTIFLLVCYPLSFQYCVWKYLWVWHVWVIDRAVPCPTPWTRARNEDPITMGSVRTKRGKTGHGSSPGYDSQIVTSTRLRQSRSSSPKIERRFEFLDRGHSSKGSSLHNNFICPCVICLPLLTDFKRASLIIITWLYKKNL